MKTKLKIFMAVLLAAAAMFALPVLANDAPSSGGSGNIYTVMVPEGYLALRNDTAFSASNEIGKLYTGDTVSFISQASNSSYWYVYAPTLGKNGYVNKNYLYQNGSSFTMTVKVSSGYLALRNAKAYNSANEIGKLYTGDTVEVMDHSGSTYWYVYSSKLNKSGYVNKDYLEGTVPSDSNSGSTAPATVSGTPMTVKVSSGYLALRNAKAYDSSNEIGKLYNGETVYVQDSSSSTYWYVYSTKLNKYGYVNKDYLAGSAPAPAPAPVTPPSSYTEYTARVSDGYLALRSAQAFDSSNEIGKLYTGDSFYVTQTNGQYWYGYSPKLNKYGYVNRDYLQGSGSYDPTYNTPKTVSVPDGYLALRNAQAFDSSNEIGKLYSGDTVYVQSSGSGQYWYVYSPTLGKYGYVNRDYLY